MMKLTPSVNFKFLIEGLFHRIKPSLPKSERIVDIWTGLSDCLCEQRRRFDTPLTRPVRG